MSRPQPEEFGVFYQKYIDTVSDNVIADLEAQVSSFPEFLNSIPTEKENYAYAEGKWTIKELLGHVIDTERIMTYRLTRFSRMDKTELAGFEENSYVANAHFKDRSMKSFVEEFKLLRSANMFLFQSLSEEELNRKGVANGNAISVKALLFVIAGHLKHHRNIITERYL
ncbi:MAG TPA: DinB family protein [Sphingobacteriaceae bacterium]|nr:DinB family protein [Sphingobacteriaceae bacterium]